MTRVRVVLEARYQDLEDWLRARYKLERQEVLDDVFVKTVGKVLRLAHTHDPTRSSEFTWMCMVGKGVAVQVLKRLDARTGLNPEAPVDVYLRGERVTLIEDRDQYVDERTEEPGGGS
jgi:hypothetical protein